MASEDGDDASLSDFSRFSAEYAKSGRSGCKYKECTDTSIAQGDLRLGKSFKRTDGVVVTNWFHASCFFEAMRGAKKWTVTAAPDFAGYDALKADDKSLLESLVAAHPPQAATGRAAAATKGGSVAGQKSLLSFFGGAGATEGSNASSAAAQRSSVSPAGFARARFLPFCDLQEALAVTPGMADKQALIRSYVDTLSGVDLLLAFKLGLPKEDKRVYGIKDRALMMLLPPIFGCNESAFATAVKDSGDISVTAARFYRDPFQLAGTGGGKASKRGAGLSGSARGSVTTGRVASDDDGSKSSTGSGHSFAKQWGGLHSQSLKAAALEIDAEDDATVIASARHSSAAESPAGTRDAAGRDATLISSDEDDATGNDSSALSSGSAATATAGSASSSSSSTSASGPWLGRAPRAPPATATLTLHEVDAFLTKLSTLSKDSEYARALSSIVPRCTARELTWLVRIVRKDLRTGAQASLYLQALGGQTAIDMYRRSAQLDDVVKAYAGGHGSGGNTSSASETSVSGGKRPRPTDDSSTAVAATSGQVAKRARLDAKSDGADVDVVVSEGEDMAASSAKPQQRTTAGGGAAAATTTMTSDSGANAIMSLGAIRPGVPVKPMLAAPVTSIAQGMAKMKAGMVAEIKYDGTRVQVHKSMIAAPVDSTGASVPAMARLAAATTRTDIGSAAAGRGGDDEDAAGGAAAAAASASSAGSGGKTPVFTFFSRSLKPSKDDQVDFLEQFLPSAFPEGDTLILDGEVLLVSADGAMLPFAAIGTEERHKYPGAHPCLFVFDILFYNGRSLLGETFKARRALLERVAHPIRNYVELSCAYDVTTKEQLEALMQEAVAARLEGLMLKDKGGAYECNMRRWVKLKRDHLTSTSQPSSSSAAAVAGGSDTSSSTMMADTVDLVVLGSYLGKGQYGGMQSVWLLGCYDDTRAERGVSSGALARKRWKTVAKVGNGLTDDDTARLNRELAVTRVTKPSDVPAWLDVTSTLVPDYVVDQPAEAPVWEVSGAEFTASIAHTAGVSIRFPRVSRERHDKTPEEANTLMDLLKLHAASTTAAAPAEAASASSSSSSSSSAAVSVAGGSKAAVGVHASSIGHALSLTGNLTKDAREPVDPADLGIVVKTRPRAAGGGKAAKALGASVSHGRAMTLEEMFGRGSA